MSAARRLWPSWAPRRAPAAAVAAGLAVLAVLPAFGLPLYTHNLLTLAFLGIAGALAWNWMGGYLGQVSFGHGAMFGLGGFVAARILLAAPVPAPLAWIAGGVAAGVFALGAHPTLKLRGPYFSIATIGLGEASRVLFTFWDAFTGGASGLSLPIDIGLKRQLYWWSLAFLAVTVVGSQALRRSTFGLQLLAIKSDVDAAEDVGVPSTLRQDIVFVLSGAAVGVTGGLYASYFSFIDPNDLFGFDRSISFVLMAVIGGVGTVLGPAMGAVVFVLIRQYLLGSYPQLYLGLYGTLLILIILFEPLGLSGLGLRVARRFGYRARPDLALGSAAAAAPSKEAAP
jgi:branched-chain amino acid transport system permease protein